jgi:hypothetical protein
VQAWSKGASKKGEGWDGIWVEVHGKVDLGGRRMGEKAERQGPDLICFPCHFVPAPVLFSTH